MGALERGEINPTYTVLMKVARGIGLKPSQLLRAAEEIDPSELGPRRLNRRRRDD
jgi:hypothetical protein